MLYFAVEHRVKNPIGLDNYNRRLRINMHYTMRLFAKRVQTKIRQRMKSGKYASNSPPWMAAKGGSNSPLYHTGHMSTTLNVSVIKGYGNNYIHIYAGWIKNSPHPRPGSGMGVQEIVGWLQDVQSWTPRRSQVKAFWAKVPKEWKSQNPPMFKPEWRSPHEGEARDFLKDVRMDPHVNSMFHQYIQQAHQRTMAGK